jgi:hypothetical protein
MKIKEPIKEDWLLRLKGRLFACASTQRVSCRDKNSNSRQLTNQHRSYLTSAQPQCQPHYPVLVLRRRSESGLDVAFINPTPFDIDRPPR